MSDVCDASVTDSRNCDRKVKFKKLKIRKYKRYIHVIFTEKPRPDGLALVFQECKPGQSRMKPSKWPGLAHSLDTKLGFHTNRVDRPIFRGPVKKVYIRLQKRLFFFLQYNHDNGRLSFCD